METAYTVQVACVFLYKLTDEYRAKYTCRLLSNGQNNLWREASRCMYLYCLLASVSLFVEHAAAKFSGRNEKLLNIIPNIVL